MIALSGRVKITKFLLVFLVFMLFSFSSFTQVCNGNLGENIFPDGDFGSGNTNVVSTDPQIAPGYIYQPKPPPNDGYYTITNYTGLWNLFPGWIKIYDNSPDKFGYMMVVNASHEPGLFYEKEITGLCENTLYEFSADIINLLNKDANIILPNVSFLLDGVEEYNSGNVPEDEQWHTYGFTFTTKPGQYSLTLSLQNNAPGGIGNDLALDNISFRPCGPEALILPEEVTNICEDGNPILLEATLVGDAFDTPHYQWQTSLTGGNTWEDISGETGNSISHTDLSTGYFYYRYLVANGPGNLSNSKCRIVSNEKIVHVIPKYNSITDSICQGLSYKVGDKYYSTTGVYIDTLVNFLGCDSIITLDLTIIPDKGIQVYPDFTDPTCSYLTNGTFIIDSVYNGTMPVTFLFNDSKKEIGVEIKNLPGGVYPYSVTDRYGCMFNDEVTLETPTQFYIDIGSDLHLDLGDAVIISPETNYPIDSYQWEPADLIACENDCWDLQWVPLTSTKLSLEALSEKQCFAGDSISITVEVARKVYFPTAFSPNNDGNNDYFTVVGAVPNIKLVERMTIYDRWGTTIFDKYNFLPNIQNLGWDGTFKGETLSNGTFVYAVDVLFIDGVTIRYTGNVTLVK